VGTASNRDGIGARVEVAAGDLEQVKEVRAGSSFASMDSRWLTFGLGRRDLADRITIRWPSGAVDEFTGVRAGQAVVAREGQGLFPAFDCDGNGVSDTLDIADGTGAAPCAPTGFVRGDANGDGDTDVSDAVFVFVFLFRGGRAPPCAAGADANGSGGIDIADGAYLLSFLFDRGPAPPAPYPGCGIGESTDLDCDSPSPCVE
jgi:hypothetical protein